VNVAPIKSSISRAELDRIDVRVGTIETVEEVPSAESLVKLVVNFGDRSLAVVAGLKKERANPREIEGKQALFVVNLEPRKIRGILSEAMLFDIGYEDGIVPRLAVPESPVPNGARVG
jgi:tRNA-binding protein